MNQLTRRLPLLALVFLIAGGFIGGMIGSRALAEPQRPDDDLWTFGRVLSLIEDQYVGEVDSKALIEDAVAGMLQSLDPHSNYLNPESFHEMRDEQRGKFSGLGIQITKRGADKPLTIISPIDDTPADRAGLISGDVIARIEGAPTIEMTVQDAVRLLKGDKGTRVTITIKRQGVPDPFDVTIERDDIPIESIRVAFMLDDQVGMIRVSNFTSTTADELDRAIAQLTEKGMTRLLVDLRGNPGGLLDQAVQVSERFIPADKLIVFTRGRIHGSDQDYYAKRGVNRVDLPLVVLVDESSASASEIVSGAIQDHDRGLVVGEATFGKGLVQRVIPLQSGGALAVTTAKYYTPSGRLIQRDYSDLEEYYLGRAGEAGDDELPAPSPRDDEQTGEPTEVEPTEVFYTASGRKVFGGGGIRPDYMVKAERAPDLLFDLLRENMIFDFAVRYNNEHAELDPEVPFDDAALADFERFLERVDFEYDRADLAEHKEIVRLRLRAQIARVRWDQNAEARILALADPQVQRAVGLFGEAAELSEAGADGEPGQPATPKDHLRAARDANE
ncbi:MAG TPA: S41 family peptidase [Candidatus Polarisedimenticolaceae bacterium]|nr:S41 family peptidase [Candidatus Polarisedimenticolaceae bacterium]